MATAQRLAQHRRRAGWRAFGSADDLDVEFGTDDRQALVTALLASCGAPRDARYWWAQPVSRRIGALLRVLAMTEATDRLELQAACGSRACAELFEFELPLAMLMAQARAPAEEVVWLTLGDGGHHRSVSMRRPRGADLRAWRRASLQQAGPANTRQAAVKAMLDSLIVEGEITIDDEAELAATLAAMDPLVAFTVTCPCPVCGENNAVRVDLEQIVLARLRRCQTALLREIHLLATHYGWSEREVLAVPPARRRRYLDWLGDTP